MKYLLTSTALVLSISIAHAEKPSASDIADICRNVANVCVTTCNVSVPNSGSFSADLTNVLTCEEKCSDSYRQCVGGLERKAQRQNKLKKVNNSLITDQ